MHQRLPVQLNNDGHDYASHRLSPKATRAPKRKKEIMGAGSVVEFWKVAIGRIMHGSKVEKKLKILRMSI